jgi:hypothetical protein
MSRWYRVFAAADEQPDPAQLLERLQALGVTAPVQLRGDDDGWTALEVALAEGVAPLVLECFLVGEPGIRAELNNWAAWLETCDDNPNSTTLMERVIQARQLYTLRRPDEGGVNLDEVCAGLCCYLAAEEGVYQADGVGFFAADGALLLREG